MHQDTSRLRAHLQRPDFYFQEISQDSSVVAACEHWPLLADIFSTDGSEKVAIDSKDKAAISPSTMPIDPFVA